MAFEDTFRSNVRPLLIPVEAHTDECLLSLLVRSAEANMFRRTTTMLSLGGVTKSIECLPFCGSQFIAVLATQLSLKNGKIQNLMHIPDSARRGSVRWFGTRMPRHYIESHCRRVAPNSLLDRTCHRAIWTVKPLSYCPETFNLLENSCPNCNKILRWRAANSIEKCEHCTADLSAGNSNILPAEFHEEAKSVANLIHPHERLRSIELARLPQPFRDWDAGDVFQAVVELGLCSVEPIAPLGCKRWRNLQRGNFADYSINELIAGYRFVKNWPVSLNLHLDKLTAKRKGGVRELMGRMGKYFDFQASDTPLRELLVQSIPHQLRELNAPIRRDQVKGLKIETEAKNLSCLQASIEFNISRKTLQRLATSDRCCVPRTDFRSVSLFNRKFLKAAIENWRASVTYEEATQTLGIPWYCFDEIAQAGIVEATTNYDAVILAGNKQLVVSASIDNLTKQIGSLPAKGFMNSAVSFKEAMFGELRPQAWRICIAALLNGRISIAGRLDNGSTVLDRLLVDATVIKQICIDEADRHIPEIIISASLAAELLGLKNNLVSGAFQNGLIEGRATITKIEVALPKVAEFQRRYIFAQEVTRLTGTAQYAFTSMMRSAGFIAVDQIHKMLMWQRSDAQILFPSQFSCNQ